MKKSGLILTSSVVVIILAGSFFILQKMGYVPGSSARSRKGPCIETLTKYTNDLQEFSSCFQNPKDCKLPSPKLKLSAANPAKSKKRGAAGRHLLADTTIEQSPPPIPFPTPDPVIIQIILQMEQINSQLIQQLLGCQITPLPITKDKILEYPLQPPPPPCPPESRSANPGFIGKQDKVLALSRSIGRLKIRTSDPKALEKVTFWGTAFVVAPGVLATNCHLIEPLLPKDWKPGTTFYLRSNEKFVIDFGESRSPQDQKDEFEIKHMLNCSQTKGMDITLLEVEQMNPAKTPLPAPLALLDGKFEEIQKEPAVVIGYPDFQHFIDATTRDMYAPFVDSSKPANFNFAKFLSIDRIEEKVECGSTGDKDPQILLDAASTTIGQSGSVVLDLLPDGAAIDPIIVGVHTCCATYFDPEKGEPPESYLPCAKLRRTFYNQDISSWSIARDRTLCSILRDKGAILRKHDGRPTAFDCH